MFYRYISFTMGFGRYIPHVCCVATWFLLRQHSFFESKHEARTKMELLADPVKKSGLGYQRPRLLLKTGAYLPGSSWLP